jgi:hypothetical protein
MSFNTVSFIWLLLATLLPFWWVLKIKDLKYQLLVFFLVVFIYLYCGFGLTFDSESNTNYGIYYTIYMMSLGFSLFHFYKKDVKIPISNNINYFSLKHSLIIILIYSLFYIIPLIQNGHLGRLLSPPTPDISEDFNTYDFSKNQFSNILGTLKNFVAPFFFLALYKYVKKPWKIILIYVILIYISYCETAYAGRSGLAVYGAFIFLVLVKYYPKARKAILFGGCIAVPLIIIFFAAYADIRQGRQSDNNSFNLALEYLYQSELTFYKWFDNVINFKSNYATNYIAWLFTLPLPGFLKPIEMNMNFTAMFTMDVLGLSSASQVDNILLPSLVNESIFIFGKYFFFLHAVILGFIFSITYNSLRKNPANFLVLLSVLLDLCFRAGRAGTIGPYAPIFKLLFVFFLFYLLSSKKKTKITQ